MIFPTIMFWVWMQAQSTGTVTLPVCSDIVTTGCVYTGTSNRTAAPAEHVIEIRTKREHVDAVCDSSGWCDCPSDGWSPWMCERVTREIWVDGVKWGVLREAK